MTGPESLVPAIKEAKSTRFQMSLLLLATVVAAAYMAGRDAGQGATQEQMKALVSVHDKRLETIAKSLEAQAEISKLGFEKNEAAIDRLSGRVQVISAQNEVIRSHVSK